MNRLARSVMCVLICERARATQERTVHDDYDTLKRIEVEMCGARGLERIDEERAVLLSQPLGLLNARA
jgi:hypothetical protein